MSSYDLDLKPTSISSSAWMITFIDILSILISCFILFYATSTLNSSEMLGKNSHLKPIEMVDNLSYLHKILSSKLKNLIYDEQINIHIEDDHLLISIDSDKLFKSDSDVLLTESSKILTPICECLMLFNNHTKIKSLAKIDRTMSKKISTLPMRQALVIKDFLKKLDYNFAVEAYSSNLNAENFKNISNLVSFEIYDYNNI